jgi:hypothetical protein
MHGVSSTLAPATTTRLPATIRRHSSERSLIQVVDERRAGQHQRRALGHAVVIRGPLEEAHSAKARERAIKQPAQSARPQSTLVAAPMMYIRNRQCLCARHFRVQRRLPRIVAVEQRLKRDRHHRLMLSLESLLVCTLAPIHASMSTSSGRKSSASSHLARTVDIADQQRLGQLHIGRTNPHVGSMVQLATSRATSIGNGDSSRRVADWHTSPRRPHIRSDQSHSDQRCTLDTRPRASHRLTCATCTKPIDGPNQPQHHTNTGRRVV